MEATQPGGYYFFLSYVRDSAGPDLWTTAFYRDLCAQVARLAAPGGRLDAGFMADYPASTVADDTDRTATALGASEVFVPLYSPTYRQRSWPLGEWAAFRRRLGGHGADRVRGHVQPVLWVPFAPGPHSDELDQALELGADVPGYSQNGLRAMCRLTIFKSQYATILRTLAGRIVTTAESSPLGRSPAPVTIEVTPASPEDAFVIGVIAPASVSWRPFGAEPELPAAGYTAQVAERLGLGTEKVDLLERSDGLVGSPGLVLVDPLIVTVPGGRSRLVTIVKELPEWFVILVLAGDPAVDQSTEDGGELTADVIGLLRDQEHVVKDVRDAATFIRSAPFIVAQARRRFLSRAPMFPPHPPRSPHTRGLPRLRELMD